MAYCPNCGDEVESGAAFCQSCGESLTDGEARGSDEASGRDDTRGSDDAGEPGDASGRDDASRSVAQSATEDDTRDDRPDPSYQSTTTSSGGGRTGKLPLRLGFVAGAAAFAAGYLFTYLKESGNAAEAFGSMSSLGSSPETWQGIGWMFMVMHNVTLEVTGQGGGQTMSQTFSSGALDEQWLLLVPVVALIGAGYFVASNADLGPNVSGAKAGATVVVGYFVCAVAIAFLSEWSLSSTTFGQQFTITMGPKLVEAALIAGVGYPVVLGGIGGALGDS